MTRKNQIVSQRTQVAMMRAFRKYGSSTHEVEGPRNIGELLYERGFPNWFVVHSQSHYGWDWQTILPDLRSSQFFFPQHTYFGGPGANITEQRYLNPEDAKAMGEALLQQLAALATTLPEGEPVARSLELDGFQVNQKQLQLVPLASVTSEREEEERVTSLVNHSGLTNSAVVLVHIRDARELFLQQKDHPSMGEARNFVQALIDGISADTNASGVHSVGYPGAMANRLKYLEDVGFFTTDEKTAVGSAWGFLCAGSHPGVPSRDQARIALILSLEFGVMLLLKFSNWKANGFRGFS
jgi:hypothetical protein